MANGDDEREIPTPTAGGSTASPAGAGEAEHAPASERPAGGVGRPATGAGLDRPPPREAASSTDAPADPPAAVTFPAPRREPPRAAPRPPAMLRTAAAPVRPVLSVDDDADPRGGDAPRAHFVARVAAWVLDSIALSLMNLALVWVAASAVIAVERLVGHPLVDASDVVSALSFAGSFGLGIGYFVVLHAHGGQTLGKAMLNIRVQRVDGTPFGLARSAVRWVGYVVSAIPLGAGFLWALLPPRRAWHDYLAGTVVVRVP